MLTYAGYIYALQGRGGPGMASNVGWFPFFFVHHLVYVYIFQEKKVYLYAFNFYAYFMFMDAYTDFLMDWHR